MVESVHSGVATMLSDHFVRAYTKDRVEPGSVVAVIPTHIHSDGLMGDLVRSN